MGDHSLNDVTPVRSANTKLNKTNMKMSMKEKFAAAEKRHAEIITERTPAWQLIAIAKSRRADMARQIFSGMDEREDKEFTVRFPSVDEFIARFVIEDKKSFMIETLTTEEFLVWINQQPIIPG
jgi:hypothetical protein